MILLDAKSQTTTSSPLGLSPSEEEPTLSFSALLKGFNPKEDAKVVQNGTLVLSLADDAKDVTTTPKLQNKETLLSLLKSDDKVSEKMEPLEINPKIRENLTTKELKVLVGDAKEYLKEKILQSDDYKQSKIKDIPKTLKGLAELAQKVGIDVSKITIEEVQVKSLTKGVPNLENRDVKQELKTQAPLKAELKQEVKVETLLKGEFKQEVKAQTPIKAEVKTEVKQEVKIEAPIKAEVKTEVKQEVKIEAPIKAEVKTEVKQEIKTEAPIKAEVKTEVKQEVKTEAPIKAEVKTETPLKSDVKQEVKQQVETAVEIKKLDSSKQVELPSKTPLFKAQTMTEHTTEQLVATKQFKREEKTPINRADETLKLLLRGEKTLKTSTNLTADFSVSTARVIAPGATSEATKSLESLLRGESGDTSSVKTDGLTTHKADSFEVKLNEAKQMVKYLSADVKTAIEDYKSPFTRVKVQLNPQKLGEVDVTIVQRGKNLHVNISSNNAAINTLSANVNELRVQLSNSGINNATLNFNNGNQSEQQNSSGQQNREQERQAREEYARFDNEETDEEILSSLEIVVPSYA